MRLFVQTLRNSVSTRIKGFRINLRDVVPGLSDVLINLEDVVPGLGDIHKPGGRYYKIRGYCYKL